MSSLSTQSRKHAFAERGHDLYSTPACAVHALLRVERLPHRIWEPACGLGSIVNVLFAAGFDVVATDIHNHNCPPITPPGYLSTDFLKEQRAPAGTECILTNPPYKAAAAFVRHALNLCPRVIMLLRLAFLESVGRSDIIDGGKLARVYPFKNRLPTGPRASSAIAYAWFCWDAAHKGPPELHRISWERS